MHLYCFYVHAASVSAEPKLKYLMRELPAHKWEDIGIELEVDEHTLHQIKKEHNDDSRKCLREMLRSWLHRIDPPPSWAAITDALQSLGDKELAIQLRDKYIPLGHEENL